MSNNIEYFADDITMYLCYPKKIEEFKSQIQKMFDKEEIQKQIPDIDINIISFINFYNNYIKNDNHKNTIIPFIFDVSYKTAGESIKIFEDNVLAYILNQYNTKKKCLKITYDQKNKKKINIASNTNIFNKMPVDLKYKLLKQPNIINITSLDPYEEETENEDEMYYFRTRIKRQQYIWETYFWSSKKSFKSIVDRMKKKIIHSFRFAEVPEKFITVQQEKHFKTIPWSRDMKKVIDSIRDGNKYIWEIITETKKTYLRVKDIKERMLRIPLLGNPTNCRLNPTHLEEKKIHTFCCLLMLSVSYSVPMIRAVNWEIVNKTWMMMLHQYKNIINEDGFWLVVENKEEIQKKQKYDNQYNKMIEASKESHSMITKNQIEMCVRANQKLQPLTFHGGRLLELVVRIYNLRITQDDDKGLKLFKPGVNNYRTYLEKYFEKMQPFMTPLEVKDCDTIADVIIKESWVHPKSLIDDVVEPFCKNMSVLLGFGDNPKIVYNDYFD